MKLPFWKLLKKYVNPFAPNGPFLYSLKTPENITVFWCFQGLEKGCIGNKWIKLIRCELFYLHVKYKEYMAKKWGNINFDGKILKGRFHFLNSIIQSIAITPLWSIDKEVGVAFTCLWKEKLFNKSKILFRATLFIS